MEQLQNKNGVFIFGVCLPQQCIVIHQSMSMVVQTCAFPHPHSANSNLPSLTPMTPICILPPPHANPILHFLPKHVAIRPTMTPTYVVPIENANILLIPYM